MKKLVFAFTFIFISTFVQSQHSTCKEDLFPRRDPHNGKMGYMDLFDNWKINPKYFEVFPFENSHAKVRLGNTYGMINCKGEEVIPPRFEALGFISFGRIWAKDKQGWTIWDSSGNQLNQEHFEEYKKTSIWNASTWVKSNNKWKMLDEHDGKFICDKTFYTIKILSDTLSLVSDDFYYGIINHKNCVFKIPETIVSAAKVSSKFLKIYYLDRTIDIVDRSGNSILQKPYYAVESAGNGLAKVKSENKWGLIKPNGEIVLELEYDSITYFKNDLIPVSRNGKWFYLKSNLKPAFQNNYLQASEFHKEQAIIKNDQGWNIINTSGELLSDSSFNKIILDEEKYYGKVNEGFVQIPYTSDKEVYDSIYFDDPIQFTRVIQSGQINIYDFKNLKWVVQNNYDDIVISSSNNLIVKTNGKMGIIDSTGKTKVQIKYKSISLEPGFNRPLFLAELDDTKYLIDQNGKVLISAKNLVRQNIYFIEKEDPELKVFNEKGEILIEEKLDAIKILDPKHLAFEKKGHWGFMKIEGEEVVKPIYTQLNVLSEHQVSVKTKENKFQILFNSSAPIKEELFFDEVIGKFGEGYLVKSDSKLQWFNERLSIREKDFTTYQLINASIIAIQKNNTWKIYSSDGHLISDKTFSELKNENNLFLFRSGDRRYIVNSLNKVVPYLPFE